jgi:tetratricopeptide (TPR) repeat protein
LGDLYEDRGQYPLAEAQYRAAIAQADVLTGVESSNTLWIDYGVRARLDLGRVLLETGRREEATAQTAAACRSLATLLSRGTPRPDWRKDAVICDLAQAKLALASGAKDQALNSARKAVNRARTIHSADKVADAFRVARAYRAVGDGYRQIGNLQAARAAFQAALAAIPLGVPEEPDEIAERTMILLRLGRASEADQLARQLSRMGYHKLEMSGV